MLLASLLLLMSLFLQTDAGVSLVPVFSLLLTSLLLFASLVLLTFLLLFLSLLLLAFLLMLTILLLMASFLLLVFLMILVSLF
jgi:hypothetical protein